MKKTEKEKEYDKAYSKSEKGKATAKRYWESDKGKASKKRSYEKHKAKRLSNMKVYTAANRKKINEQQRVRRYKNANKPVKERTFSFYRDVVMNADQAFFDKLLELNLTDKQRELVLLTKSGLSQPQIAEKLGRNQSSINKMWNGSKKCHGGIVGKVRRAYEKSIHVMPDIISLFIEGKVK